MNALVQVVVIVVKVVAVVINCCSREDGGGDGAGIHHQHSCHYQYVITEAVTVCQFSFFTAFPLVRSYSFLCLCPYPNSSFFWDSQLYSQGFHYETFLEYLFIFIRRKF
jgi:hypothetical protein